MDMQMKRQTQRYVIALGTESCLYLPWDAVQKTPTLPLNKESLDTAALQLYSYAQTAFSYLEIFIESEKIPT